MTNPTGMPGMTDKSDPYIEFVDHPRYGRRPRITGLDPSPADPNVALHWNAITPHEVASQYEATVGEPWPYGDPEVYARATKRIPNTAVLADLERQTPATVSVTHYFDLERSCRDCGRGFLFFACEQKHWYEELGFGLASDCVRCVECRRKQRGIARQREIYESLFHVRDRSQAQDLQMADACISLIEDGVFHRRQTERVRALLRPIAKSAEGSEGGGNSACSALVARLRTILTQG